MKIVEEFGRDPERVFDRLADGELEPGDRRALIAILDDEPGAWRRCVLKFLEAQTLSGQLSGFVAHELTPAVSHPLKSADQPAARRLKSGLMALALAASLLAAFLLGTQLPRAAVSRGEVAAVDGKATHSVQPSRAVVEMVDSVGDPSAPSADDDETLTLALADDASPQGEFQLRMAAADETQIWPDSDSAELSPELVREIEQAGLQVSRQTRWLPVDLSDGRRAIVPVEEVQIHSLPY